MMSAALRPMTAAEFLEWEEQQELRYEFDGVAVEAMVRGTAAHTAINDNLAMVLKAALRGGPCRFLGSDLKLHVSEKYRYPDAMVVCAPVELTATFVTEATIVFEVLSSSTATKDLSVKNDGYRSIPSVLRYVMLEQDRIAATIFSREGEEWLGRRLVGPNAVLDMPEIGVWHLMLGQFNEGLRMDEAAVPS